jgi:branched-chain amino acid transport system substrate-binding protein
MRRDAESCAKNVNAKGGLPGRQIQIFPQDTAGDPATAVRKAQDVVERDGCGLSFGITLSSGALAVVAKLDEWNAIFMSSDNGDGRLTGASFVPNFFRANTSSGPMETRAISMPPRQADFKKMTMRACDHLAAQQGFIVKVVCKEGFTDPIPQLIAPFAPDQVTPACRQMTFDS